MSDYPRIEVRETGTETGRHRLWIVMDPLHARHMSTGTKNEMYDLAQAIKDAPVGKGETTP